MLDDGISLQSQKLGKMIGWGESEWVWVGAESPKPQGLAGEYYSTRKSHKLASPSFSWFGS